MTPPVVDAYLDELLAEVTPEAAEAAAGAPAPTPAPAPAPTPTPTASLAPPMPVAVPAPTPTPQQTPAPSGPAAAIATELPAPPPAADASSRWLRIGVGRDHYAFELLRVQEVVRVAPMVAMRGAAPFVLGVMNLRGRIVPVYDMGRWLDGACIEVSDESRVVVVERDDELIGVLVTRVEDVATLSGKQIEPPLIGSAPGAIVGIARVGRLPTVLLDANALFG